MPEQIRVQKRNALQYYTGLGTVPVVWGEKLRQSYGNCAHVNFQTSVYQHVGSGGWIDRMNTMNSYQFRSLYSQSLANTSTAVTRCRNQGVKWLMLVTPDDFSMTNAEIRQRIQHIAANAADVCIGIEGINEPNNSGDPDWADKTVSIQAAIWDEVTSTPALSHVTVVGPSLHASVANVEQHHVTLGNKGINNYIHAAGLHRYSGGRAPGYLIDERIGWIAAYWNNPDVWVTETGYTNALNRPSGHVPINNAGSSAYSIRNLLEFRDRPKIKRVFRYEFLDDPNPANDDIESNFGLVECDATGSMAGWTNKTEYNTMQDFLGTLRDSASFYNPPDIPLEVTGNVSYWVTKTTTGNNFLWLYRPGATVWDIDTLSNITVSPINVGVTTTLGSQTIPVAGSTVKVDLGF